MRVIFLDIDGVLNHGDYFATLREEQFKPPTKWLDMLDPSRIDQLNALVYRTAAHVVISSSWRLALPLDSLREVLVLRGYNQGSNTILDVTPRIPGAPRGLEIARWLREHPEVTRVVILDDYADMEYLSPWLVQTHMHHHPSYPDGPLGLHPEAVNAAVALLTEGPAPRLP